MAWEVTERNLFDLGHVRFQQLVASLVFAEHPEAERPANPDGGADVLVPATGGGRARVWQAKHFTSAIAWKKCEDSLDAAVAAYDPEAVTFVLPRDLTRPQRDKFHQRLVTRHASVNVTHWSLHRIQELLARHPDIAKRYFGEDPRDVVPGLLRAMKQGGKQLENTRDLADRAFGLDGFANITDPTYEYEMSFGRADAPPRVWTDAPFMVIEQLRGGRRVTTEARLRPEAQADAAVWFTDDAAGDRAREDVREAFAAGESVELTEGVCLRVDNVPVAAKEALDAAKAEGYEQQSARLSPGEPHEFELRMMVGAEEVTRAFTVRPLPAPPDAQLSYGSIQDALALFLDFTLTTPPVVSLNLRISWRQSDRAARNAEAAKFMLGFFRADRVALIAPGFLPAGGLMVGGDSKPSAALADIAHLEVHAALYDAVSVIEQTFGPLELPDAVSRDEFENAVTAANIIRSGGGTFALEQLALEVPLNEVDQVIRTAQKGHPGRHPVELTVFGRKLDLGLAEFKTPPITLVATERGRAPNTVLLLLRTEKTDVPFRLVGRGSDDAPNLSSKLWTPDRGPSGMVNLPT